jgi:hypothetical protein
MWCSVVPQQLVLVWSMLTACLPTTIATSLTRWSGDWRAIANPSVSVHTSPFLKVDLSSMVLSASVASTGKWPALPTAAKTAPILSWRVKETCAMRTPLITLQKRERRGLPLPKQVRQVQVSTRCRQVPWVPDAVIQPRCPLLSLLRPRPGWLPLTPREVLALLVWKLISEAAMDVWIGGDYLVNWCLTV